MKLKDLNKRHAHFWDSAGGPRKPVAEFSAAHYRVDLENGVHRVYETDPAGVKANPLDSCTGPVGEHIARDRATVNDASQSMANRLRALNRVNQFYWSGEYKKR